MKLSIITINYNNKDGLQKTIDSVICQTWRDFEWIIIDGGSTDGSKELIEKYQQHFAYWCSEPDKGVYNAMNKGIAKAKGEYVNFMNSGDCFAEANVLEKLFACGYDEDIIAGLVKLSNGEILNQNDDNLVRMLVTHTICHQATFFKKKLFENYEYNENFRLVSDWTALVKWLLFEDKKLCYTNIVVAVYDTSGASSNMECLRAERRRAMQEYFGKRVGEELSRLYKSESYLKGELQIPAIKMLRHLYYDAPKWFSVLYRVIFIVVKIRDFVFQKTSYATFENKQLK